MGRKYSRLSSCCAQTPTMKQNARLSSSQVDNGDRNGEKKKRKKKAVPATEGGCKKERRRDPFRACAKRTSFPAISRAAPLPFFQAQKDCWGGWGWKKREAAAIRARRVGGKTASEHVQSPSLRSSPPGVVFQQAGKEAFPFQERRTRGTAGRGEAGRESEGKGRPSRRTLGPALAIPFGAERLNTENLRPVGRFFGSPPHSRGGGTLGVVVRALQAGCLSGPFADCISQDPARAKVARG